eukprot:IDg3658t1
MIGQQDTSGHITPTSEEKMDLLFSYSSSDEEGMVLDEMPLTVEQLRDVLLWNDYLVDDRVYPPSHFRSRFWVPLKLFRRLLHDLPIFDTSLRNSDAIRKLGATSWQNILNSLRRLGSAESYDMLDDQSRMSASSQRVAFKSFFES